MNLSVTLLIATFIGMASWHSIGRHKASATLRGPALFFCVIHQGIVASLQGTHSFPLERAIMLRERASGAYYVSAYFLAKTFCDMSIQVFFPIIFSITVYPLVDFQNTANQVLVIILYLPRLMSLNNLPLI
jgi:ATP-binding cassette subfamily G (WHITE) protein 2